jgi:hypothetical protein
VENGSRLGLLHVKIRSASTSNLSSGSNYEPLMVAVRN